MQRYSGFGLFKHSLSHHENWQRMWRTPTPKKVYDVVIEGVSLVQNYRSQFGQLLMHESPDAVIAKISQKRS